MKYSIKGNLEADDEKNVIELLDSYKTWRLITGRFTNIVTGESMFGFEVWLDNKIDKDRLFDELKPMINKYGEYINWHECTHDEEFPQPCVNAEEYRGE